MKKFNVPEFKAVMAVKEAFSGKRHFEKKEIASLRFELAMKLLNHRDVFAGKRHNERLTLLMKRYETPKNK